VEKRTAWVTGARATTEGLGAGDGDGVEAAVAGGGAGGKGAGAGGRAGGGGSARPAAAILASTTGQSRSSRTRLKSSFVAASDVLPISARRCSMISASCGRPLNACARASRYI